MWLYPIMTWPKVIARKGTDDNMRLRRPLPGEMTTSITPFAMFALMPKGSAKRETTIPIAVHGADHA